MKRGFLGSSKKVPADSRTIPCVGQHCSPRHCSLQLCSFWYCSSRHCSSKHCSSKHCSSNSVHPVKNDTTCGETEKVEVLILKVDENGMVRDEEGQPRRATEAETSDPTSTLIDTTPATSINTNTSMSIDISTSESIDIGTSETIDTDFCHRSIPLEIPERSSCPQDIADSTHKSTDVSSCSPSPDVEKEITIEDFFKLEEFLELEDGEKLEDLYSKKKLDDDQHTSRGDLETSKAIIDRHQPDEIDRHPPHVIDQRPPYIIDRHSSDNIDLHPHSIIDRHPLKIVDQHPSLEELPGYIVELEQRPPIWTEEAAGFHKKVKRIHDPVKIVVPCAVFEAETSIPPDRSMQFSSYIVVLDDHPHVEASHRGLRFRDEVDKGPAEATSIDTDQIPSNDTNKPASIDITTSPSTDTGRVSEQKEFDVCRNLRDGDTTTRSDKSGEKKRRN
ncbi:hypothetical protein F2Q70_00004337 [Brassica cretica]|uniref:Uncharacterized protein n=1 Tax=Brassica cretica TaxID=69181 RepID=A0A8S9J1E2_BRACR|nr:hypothetical protein F2Q70_00004337 [Brassica cretica]